MPNTKHRTLTVEEERIRNQIANWFEASNMTQQAVAERVGLGQAAVSAFILGKRFGSLDTVRAFCECFGHEMGDLFREAPRKVSDPEAQRVMQKFRAMSPAARKAVESVMDTFLEPKRHRRK